MFDRVKKNRLLLNFFKISTGTLLSRVFGFLRELVVAFYFGTSKYTDAFFVAFTIPTLFRRVLGEDMVEKALIPPVKILLARKDKKGAAELASELFNVMFVVLLFLMFFLYLITPLLVKIIAPALEKETFDLAVKFTYVVLPFMIFIGLAAFLGGVLNYIERNIIYSFAPIMMSLGVISGLIFLRPVIGYYALSLGFVIGAFLQFIIQIPFVLNRKIKEETGLTYSFKFKIKKIARRKIAGESIYIGFQSVLNKSVEIVDRILASFLITGSISGLYYSQRLVQLPNAVIGLAISRSVTPYLTEKNALKNVNDFKKGLLYGLRFNLSLILPIVVISVILKNEIISVVYKRGDFNQSSVLITSLPFWCYVLGLPGMSMNFILTRAFSAIQRNKIPFYVSIFATIINVLLSILFVRTELKHGGLALASSIAFSFNSLVLFIMLNKFLEKNRIKILLRELFKPLIKIIINTAVFTCIVYYVSDILRTNSFLRRHFTDFFVNLTILAGTVATGFLVYGIFYYILKDR